MKSKIRFITVLIISLMIAGLCSCSSDKADDNRLKVIGTVFPQFDFARQIGKDRADCEMLLRPGADSHSYTGEDPSDLYRIMNCDLFIYVGGETDSEWVMKIKDKLDSSDEKQPVFLALCDVCDVMSESVEGIVEAEDETEEAGYDEHVWTSPENAEKAVCAICDAMCELDPDNSDYYRKNCDEYVKELDALDSDFKNLFDNTESKTLVFADRFPFRYFANEYGLKCYAAFNGCASQSEPAPTTIVKLCKIVEDEDLPYVYYIETSQSGVPDAISKYTGCGKMLLHSCHTVTERELENGATYLSLMRQNLDNLRKAINDEQ